MKIKVAIPEKDFERVNQEAKAAFETVLNEGWSSGYKAGLLVGVLLTASVAILSSWVL